MADSTLGWYALSTDSSQNTEFQVAAMDGVEALGETYYFDLDLVSPNFNLDLSELFVFCSKQHSECQWCLVLRSHVS